MHRLPRRTQFICDHVVCDTKARHGSCRLFGKEFSSDNAGDGPWAFDDWAIGYKGPPTNPWAVKRAISSLVAFTADELKFMHPYVWLHYFFQLARVFIAKRLYARLHERERKNITRTWRYIFRHKTIPLTFEQELQIVLENNLKETCALLSRTFDPPDDSGVRANEDDEACLVCKHSEEENCVQEVPILVKPKKRYRKKTLKKKRRTSRVKTVRTLRRRGRIGLKTASYWMCWD